MKVKRARLAAAFLAATAVFVVAGLILWLCVIFPPLGPVLLTLIILGSLFSTLVWAAYILLEDRFKENAQ